MIKIKKDKYLCTSGDFCIRCETFTPAKGSHISPMVCGKCAKWLHKKLSKLKGFYVTTDNQYIEEVV